MSYVNEPYYLKGAFHQTLQGAGKLDFGETFRAVTRLSLSREAYGLFEPRRDPRAWDVAWGILGGAHMPFLSGGLEASAGVGAILGRNQGELYYRHVWDGGIFPDRSNEYRNRLYADAGIPFQLQWIFGRNQKGLGLEFSGFISQEVQHWGIGFCWQSYFYGAPVPKPIRAPGKSAPPAPPSESELPEPGSEELEE
jgi:hypothetical protein